MIIKQTGKIRLTNGAIERYRPLVKESLLSTLSEIFNEVSKEVLQPTTAKTIKNTPKPTHSIEPLSCQVVSEQPIEIIKEQLRPEMHDIEQRVFTRIEKILQNNEHDISMLSFKLLPNELVLKFNNYEFLRFTSSDQCHFSSFLDISVANEMCPYYKISSRGESSIVTFNSPADIGNIAQFILASLQLSLENNSCLQ
ncbi:hypothetical protein SAMN04490355_105649 [Pelosinus propionicus DSM 13327]|uniref:Uncharacterized protein n=1 Tax=Pelosinus propionicus DSM 13327 TaxID=1123291 RepID=A0A1I4P491_9FIRM|nr:hypothetical protein SAMN04490355_105649 [Pelosinus propionicus DSM 13327]